MKKSAFVKVTILFASMMTVMAGATIAPSLPEMTRAFEGTPNAGTLVKLVLTIPGLFIAVTAPFSGWVIDRFGRIRLLVAMLLLYSIAGTSGLFLNTLPEIIIGRAFLGIAVGGIMTTAVALIGDYFEGEERQKFLGTQAGIMAFSGTLFITAGGALADIGWRYPFAIYALALLVIPMVLIFLKEPKKGTIQTNKSEKERIPKLAWTIYVIAFFGMAIFYMIPVQVPFLIQGISEAGNTATGIAISLSMLAAGTISFNYPRFKRRLTHYQIYAVSFLIIGIGYACISMATNYWLVIPGLVIAGGGAGLIMPNSNLCLVTMAPPAVRGRVLGFLTTFLFFGQFASPIMFEPIVQSSSIKGGFLYLAIALTVISIFVLVRNKRLLR